MNQTQALLSKSLLSRGKTDTRAFAATRLLGAGVPHQCFASALGLVSQHLSYMVVIFCLLIHHPHLTVKIPSESSLSPRATAQASPK